MERLLRIVAHRLVSLWRGGRQDADLDEELLEHVDRLTEQYRARGMSDADARRTALATMGGVTRRREEMRDARGFRPITDLFRDLRNAVRSLRRTPSFTVVAVGTLSVGIAAAATVFSLVDAALFRPPPFAEADRLMVLNIAQRPASGGEWRLRWSWPRLRLLIDEAQSFESIASSSNVVVTLTGRDEPEPLAVEIVSSRYFDVMGTTLVRGRGFSPADDDPASAAAVVVLGHRYWLDRFGGSADVIGQTVQLNGI
ncbi:MAG: ABC transporter permease, partial [Gemmatimonadales bacterium]